MLLWFSAIGCGLMGGLYFAFSTFIMRTLASLAGASGAASATGPHGAPNDDINGAMRVM